MMSDEAMMSERERAPSDAAARAPPIADVDDDYAERFAATHATTR